jgi:hypothetical protein
METCSFNRSPTRVSASGINGDRTPKANSAFFNYSLSLKLKTLEAAEEEREQSAEEYQEPAQHSGQAGAHDEESEEEESAADRVPLSERQAQLKKQAAARTTSPLLPVASGKARPTLAVNAKAAAPGKLRSSFAAATPQASAPTSAKRPSADKVGLDDYMKLQNELGDAILHPRHLAPSKTGSVRGLAALACAANDMMTKHGVSLMIRRSTPAADGAVMLPIHVLSKQEGAVCTASFCVGNSNTEVSLGEAFRQAGWPKPPSDLWKCVLIDWNISDGHVTVPFVGVMHRLRDGIVLAAKEGRVPAHITQEEWDAGPLNRGDFGDVNVYDVLDLTKEDDDDDDKPAKKKRKQVICIPMFVRCELCAPTLLL